MSDQFVGEVGKPGPRRETKDFVERPGGKLVKRRHQHIRGEPKRERDDQALANDAMTRVTVEAELRKMLDVRQGLEDARDNYGLDTMGPMMGKGPEADLDALARVNGNDQQRNSSEVQRSPMSVSQERWYTALNHKIRNFGRRNR